MEHLRIGYQQHYDETGGTKEERIDNSKEPHRSLDHAKKRSQHDPHERERQKHPPSSEHLNGGLREERLRGHGELSIRNAKWDHRPDKGGYLRDIEYLTHGDRAKDRAHRHHRQVPWEGE